MDEVERQREEKKEVLQRVLRVGSMWIRLRRPAWWNGRRHDVWLPQQGNARADRRQRAGYAGTTRPWGSDTPNHSPSPPQSIVAWYSVRVPLYVLATCIPFYTAFYAQ